MRFSCKFAFLAAFVSVAACSTPKSACAVALPADDSLSTQTASVAQKSQVASDSSPPAKTASELASPKEGALKTSANPFFDAIKTTIARFTTQPLDQPESAAIMSTAAGLLVYYALEYNTVASERLAIAQEWFFNNYPLIISLSYSGGMSVLYTFYELRKQEFYKSKNPSHDINSVHGTATAIISSVTLIWALSRHTISEVSLSDSIVAKAIAYFELHCHVLFRSIIVQPFLYPVLESKLLRRLAVSILTKVQSCIAYIQESILAIKQTEILDSMSQNDTRSQASNFNKESVETKSDKSSKHIDRVIASRME